MSDKKSLLSCSVKRFGGQVKFGKKMSVSQQLVSYWVGKDRLPADRVIEAEAAFVSVGIDISRHDLRPDVFGPRDDVAQSAK
jgi:DNA-binding transcriptional regulator YdaS (Cro superfamily)